MLYLKTEDLEIRQISKLLTKYNVTASLSKQRIKLVGEIPDELILEIFANVKVLKCYNFDYSIWQNSINPTEASNEQEANYEKIETYDERLYRDDYKIIDDTVEYDLRYPNPKACEIYMCDFGNGYAHELKGIRPALVIRNDRFAANSYKTTVMPFTTKSHPENCFCSVYFCEENILNMNPMTSKKRGYLQWTERMSVDKTRLRNYVGQLKIDVLKRMQKNIDKENNSASHVFESIIAEAEESNQNFNSKQEK